MGQLDEIFGAALSGIIVNAWVFGLICILSYNYYLNFPKDGPGTKILVAWTLLLQTFDVIVVSKMIYYYLVTSFGNPQALGSSIWEWNIYLGISSVSAFSVQMFYARRILVLTQNYLLWGVISLFAFCQLGFGLATMSEAFKLVVFSRFTEVTWVCVTWLSFSAACDIIIAATQVLYLHSRRTGVTGTNRIINTLILYIISTGLLTSIVAILELTTFATLGFNFVHVFLSHPMGAIYVVSLLANLDARRSVRDIGPGTMVSPEESIPISIAFRRVRRFRTDTGHTTTGTFNDSHPNSYKNPGLTNSDYDATQTDIDGNESIPGTKA